MRDIMRYIGYLSGTFNSLKSRFSQRIRRIPMLGKHSKVCHLKDHISLRMYSKRDHRMNT